MSVARVWALPGLGGMGGLRAEFAAGTETPHPSHRKKQALPAVHPNSKPCPRVQGRWNVQTLRGILTNPVYTGEVYAGRLQEACATGATATPRRVRPRADWIAVASIPAIVTQEQFERVQDKLAQNRQFARRNNTAHAYLLRALVSCGVCGLACQGRCLPSGYRSYCCRGKLSALHSHRETKCSSRYIPTEQVDA